MNDAARFRALERLVGNTPLLEISFTYRGKALRLFAKAEHLNCTGSIKDRMALHILRKAKESGALAPGAPIAEATSGNTGIAFTALGRALGHPVTIFMPDWMSQERKDLIRSFGADIRLVSKEEGGFLGSIALSREFAASTPGCFLPRQFENDDNVEAHARTTALEICHQLQGAGLAPDAFVAGVGTGGTIMGVGRGLRARFPRVRIHPMEPSNSPTMSTGCKVGKHRIQGISDEFIPAIVQLDQLDSVVAVDDGDAIIMAQKLASQLGLGVGISSGANFLAALLLLEEMGPEAVVVTVFSDDNKKYLSTDLLRKEPLKPGFMSPEVELLDLDALNRVCEMCDRAGAERCACPLRTCP
jgi:cysteine synthase